MRQAILDAMEALAGRPFGTQPRQGEADFEKALGDILQNTTRDDGWKWRYRAAGGQERFATDALTNEGHIDVDIVGRHPLNGVVAIELKYVPVLPIKLSPSDKPAFPWTVAKDCLKLELLRGGKCLGALADRSKLQIYVIGLTNCSDYWEGNRAMSWSWNFVQAMRRTPVYFQRGIVRTTGTNNAVFGQARCHIAFGLNWEGEWRIYRPRTGDVPQFRYLLLNPDPKFGAEPQWSSQTTGEERFGTIPLLDEDAREGWRKLHMEELKRTGRA